MLLNFNRNLEINERLNLQNESISSFINTKNDIYGPVNMNILDTIS